MFLEYVFVRWLSLGGWYISLIVLSSRSVEASQKTTCEENGANMASGRGKAEAEHFTWLQYEPLNWQDYYSANTLSILRAVFLPHLEICFQPNTQTPFFTCQTIGGRVCSCTKTADTHQLQKWGIPLHKVKRSYREKRRRAGPKLGLRLSWVITESPPLLPLEKLTVHNTWRQLSPASHFFAKDSCQAEGENKFVWVIRKYPYVSMAWTGSSMDCVQDVLCLFVISILTYQLYQKANGHPTANLKSNYKSLTEILWFCRYS